MITNITVTKACQNTDGKRKWGAVAPQRQLQKYQPVYKSNDDIRPSSIEKSEVAFNFGLL